MNHLLCLSTAVLLILLQGVQNQEQKPADDLCKHPFHSFLCNPSKSGHKRRVYNGQKPGQPVPPSSNQLTGENSFLQSTQIRPELPKPVPEPVLKPDTSNVDSVFQAPGYLPPNSEKPPVNLFGDNSFLDPTRLLLPTSARPTTTRRPTTTTTTTRAPTTTRRPTTQRATTEPNIIPDAAQNTGTRIRPDPVKPVKEDLCAHAFHSFLCDSPKPTRPRRIYNGQRSSPENTNILGENSFQQPSRVLAPTKSTPKPLPSTTTYKPVQLQTTARTTTKPVINRNLIAENSFLSPTNLETTTSRPPTRATPSPTTTPRPTRRPIVVTPKPEPEYQPDAAQNPSVRLRPDVIKPTEKEDLCKHAFHSFLCDTPKPSNKPRRIYNGQKSSPENTNLLGENSFQQASRLLPPTTSSPKPVRSSTPSYKAPTTTLRPIPHRNIITDNSNLSPAKLLPTTTRAPPPTRRTTVQEPDIQPDGAQNPSVRLRPDTPPTSSTSDDLCKHSFHSFLCSGSKSTGKRRNYNGQAPNVVGANSFLNSRTLLPPQPKVKENEFQQSSNLDPATKSYLPPVPYLPPTPSRRVVRQNTFTGDNSDEHHAEVNPATSKHIPASLARGNPPTTLRPVASELEGAAADAPSVIVPADDHHHDHHHDANDHHHHDAAGHDHAHGDHHHHHHNITLEQLCRDPFHAFLCLNVDTSKRRVYDGNPAQGTPSEQDTLQALSRSQLEAASSVRQLRKIHSSQSANDIARVSSPSALIQENNAAFRFQSDEQDDESFVASASPVVTTTSTEPTRTQSATSTFLQNSREKVYNSESNQNVNSQRNQEPSLPEQQVSHSVDEVVQEASSSPQPEEIVRPRGTQRRTSQRRPVLSEPSPTADTISQQPIYRQRRPVLSEPSPTADTISQQPIYRQRRPLRRKQQTPAPEADSANKDNFYFRTTETDNIPETVNRRSDQESAPQQEQQQVQRKFGAKIPRRRRLPVQDTDLAAELTENVNPSKFVRGPRGIASDLAATNTAPDVQCSEPFHAYQCNPKSVNARDKRAANDDGEAPRRSGNMRGQAQGQETEQEVKGDDPRIESETRKERIKHKLKTKVEEKVKVEESKAVVESKDTEVLSATTEDPIIAYQKGIEEELKLREIEENNRKEELKRRQVDLQNRKEELKRREKEQEGRKEEDKRRKEEMARRKIDDEKRKLELKKVRDEDKSDDDDEEIEEDDEEKREEEEKDKLLTNYEKGVKADLKLREAEVKRREEEVERREKELIRREVEEKRRLMEAERRRVQDKRIEEELERQRIEKIRVAEELVRRQEEDDRRSEAKLKAAAN